MPTSNHAAMAVDMIGWTAIGLCAAIAVLAYRRFTTWSRQGVTESYSFFFASFSKPWYVADGEYFRRYKAKAIGYYNFFTPSLIIGDVELARKVMFTDFEKFGNHIKFAAKADTVGDALLSLPVPKWKRMKQIMSPMLTISKLRSMQPLLETSIEDMIDNIADAKDGEIDINHVMARFATDAIASTTFSAKVSELTATSSNRRPPDVHTIAAEQC